jgi:hypothetical protein
MMQRAAMKIGANFATKIGDSARAATCACAVTVAVPRGMTPIVVRLRAQQAGFTRLPWLVLPRALLLGQAHLMAFHSWIHPRL